MSAVHILYTEDTQLSLGPDQPPTPGEARDANIQPTTHLSKELAADVAGFFITIGDKFWYVIVSLPGRVQPILKQSSNFKQ